MEVGKTYLISHTRKGTFTARITAQDDAWTTGVITSGKTRAMLDYNVRETGEQVCFRTELVTSAVEQPTQR